MKFALLGIDFAMIGTGVGTIIQFAISGHSRIDPRFGTLLVLGGVGLLGVWILAALGL